MLINQVCAAIEAVRHLFPFQEFALLFKTQSCENKKKKRESVWRKALPQAFIEPAACTQYVVKC